MVEAPLSAEMELCQIRRVAARAHTMEALPDDAQGSLARDKQFDEVAFEINDSGGAVFRWYRWPIDLQGELQATLRVTCAEDELQVAINPIAERPKPAPPWCHFYTRHDLRIVTYEVRMYLSPRAWQPTIQLCTCDHCALDSSFSFALLLVACTPATEQELTRTVPNPTLSQELSGKLASAAVLVPLLLFAFLRDS